MKIGLVSDHHGIDERSKIKSYLESKGYEVVDFGPFAPESVDYPEFAFKLSKEVANNTIDKGILMCGTGIGMSIAANKVKGIRAAHCSNLEQAHLAKEHNNANIIALSYKQDFVN